MGEEIVIAARFNGPPHSGNGGYSAGLAASLVDGPARVELRAPPPLDTPLEAKAGEEGWTEIRDGETLVMRARPERPVLTRPAAPTLETAAYGRAHFPTADEHGLPTCFVCGPLRTPGDGLCIYSGPVEGFDGVADVWTPLEVFAGGDGLIRPEIIWAALDCPSYFAIPGPMRNALLASITAEIHKRPTPGETLIAAGWHDRSDGRKHFCGTALFTPDGECLAQSDTLWIELKEA